ncbi:hypothetical protein C8Q74DRAFT_1252080 [Fomes fomentarius]|nr:hypothetical protein C8Q74DRAFT_1252080 [Fomes fomentarius]
MTITDRSFLISPDERIDGTHDRSEPNALEDIRSPLNGLLHMDEPDNFELPIYMLPNETLVSIFQILQELTGWRSPYGIVNRYIPNWIRVTWVCRHWRKVALSSPILWNFIVDQRLSDGPEWVPTFLERAAGALLDVKTTSRRTSKTPGIIFQFLQPFASSIRSFHFRMGGCGSQETSFGSIFKPLAACNMNSLQTLFVDDDHAFDDNVTIDVLTREKFPRLQSLSLHGFHVPWTSSMYTSLRSLDVYLDEGLASMPMADFVEILRCSPALESLCLIGCLPSQVGDHPPAPRSLSLPKLRHLHLEGTLDVDVTSCVCDAIFAPTTKTIFLARFVSPGSRDLVSELAPQQHVYAAFLCRAQRMSLQLDDGSISLGFNLSLDDDWDYHPYKIQLSGSFSNVPVISSSAWNAVVDAVYAAQAPLTSFCLSYGMPFTITEPMWQRFFARFPGLSHLDIGDPHGTSFRNAPILDILQSSAQSAENAPGVLLCPVLRVLELNGIDLDDQMVEKLLSLVQFRASKGASLEQLVFKDPNIPDKATDIYALKGRFERLVKVTIRYTSVYRCCDVFDDHDEFILG